MTLDEALTNKEIADRLGRDPATVFHHVRTLVDTGFLVAEPVRRGVRGSRERPYRATGLSWALEAGEGDDAAFGLDATAGAEAITDAFLTEPRAASGRAGGLARLGLRLTEAEHEELASRLMAVLEDFAGRPRSRDGAPWSVFLAIHPDRRRD
jgi:predicted ArsR family transcriptional regulator